MSINRASHMIRDRGVGRLESIKLYELQNKYFIGSSWPKSGVLHPKIMKTNANIQESSYQKSN